jgi:hypothetical protein
MPPPGSRSGTLKFADSEGSGSVSIYGGLGSDSGRDKFFPIAKQLKSNFMKTVGNAWGTQNCKANKEKLVNVYYNIFDI